MGGDFVKALCFQSIVTVAQLVRNFTLLRPPCVRKSLFRESTEPEWVGGWLHIDPLLLRELYSHVVNPAEPPIFQRTLRG
jgi:hypothetical protein